MGLFSAIFGGEGMPRETKAALREAGRMDRSRSLCRETAGRSSGRQDHGWRADSDRRDSGWPRLWS